MENSPYIVFGQYMICMICITCEELENARAYCVKYNAACGDWQNTTEVLRFLSVLTIPKNVFRVIIAHTSASKFSILKKKKLRYLIKTDACKHNEMFQCFSLYNTDNYNNDITALFTETPWNCLGLKGTGSWLLSLFG